MTGTFLVIAIVSSAFLGIQILMMMFGADMDFDSDMDVDAGDGGGFMSIRSLTAFFGGFGWAGLAARQAGWGTAASLGTAIGVGVAFFFIIGFIFMQARKLTKSTSQNYDSALGQTATVYIQVPSSGQGGGKVEVNVSGRISIVDAITKSTEPIPTKTRVRVTEILGDSTVRVEPL